jgi:hypothetical protein
MKDVVERRIGKRGITYKDDLYTFDGYEKHIGKLVTFFVQEKYLVVALEDEVFHAQKQDI